MLSKIAHQLPLYLFGLLAFCFIVVFPVWKYHDYESIISWDAMGYYFYLPSFFIYHDLHHLSFIPDLLNTYVPTSYFYQAYHLPNGNYVMTYTMGVAILQLPFFIIGHLAALLLGFKADGFSSPYQLSIYVSGIFYVFASFILLRKILIEFFPSGTVNAALIVLLLGTNLGYYTFFDNGLTHGYLFFLYCVLIRYTILWYKYFKTSHIIAIAVILGLMGLTRPTEIIAVIIPLTWGICSVNDFKNRFLIIKKVWNQIFVAMVCMVVIILPQFIYWKWATGHWYFNSYASSGLHFNFKHPFLYEGLFSFKKGWLIYTPVMLLALLGVFFLRKSTEIKKMFLPLLIYFPLFIYITFSWEIWWYASGYGQRALVQSYALLAFPLAAFLNVAGKRKFLFYLSATFIFICVLLNWLKIYQYQNGILSKEGPNDSEFSLNYFSLATNKYSEIGLSGSEMSEASKTESIRLLSSNSLSIEKDKNYEQDSSSYYIKVNQSRPFVGTYSLALKQIDYKPGDKIRIYVKVRAYKTNPYAANGGNVVVAFNRSDTALKWNGFNLSEFFHEKKDYGVWKQFVFETKMPGYLKPTDIVQVYYWMSADEENDVKDMRIELISN